MKLQTDTTILFICDVQISGVIYSDWEFILSFGLHRSLKKSFWNLLYIYVKDLQASKQILHLEALINKNPLKIPILFRFKINVIIGVLMSF